MKKPLVIFVYGPPGSGKGTQADLLAKKFGLEYFDSGTALRQRHKINDFTGRKIGQIMGRGEWVPESVICNLWMTKLERFKQKRKFNGLVYEGGARIILEAKIFDVALKWYEWEKNIKTIFISISKKESFNRLTKRRQCKKCGRLIPWIGKFKELKKCDKCGGQFIVRTDDKPKTILKRLEEFKKHTIPVINYHKKQGRLIKINGEQSIEKVFQDILEAFK